MILHLSHPASLSPPRRRSKPTHSTHRWFLYSSIAVAATPSCQLDACTRSTTVLRWFRRISPDSHPNPIPIPAPALPTPDQPPRTSWRPGGACQRPAQSSRATRLPARRCDGGCRRLMRPSGGPHRGGDAWAKSCRSPARSCCWRRLVHAMTSDFWYLQIFPWRSSTRWRSTRTPLSGSTSSITRSKH